jgi:hypothetical protein
VSNTQPAAQGRRDMCGLARLGWAASPNAVAGSLSLPLSFSLFARWRRDWAVQLRGTRFDQIWRKGRFRFRFEQQQREDAPFETQQVKSVSRIP